MVVLQNCWGVESRAGNHPPRLDSALTPRSSLRNRIDRSTSSRAKPFPLPRIWMEEWTCLCTVPANPLAPVRRFQKMQANFSIRHGKCASSVRLLVLFSTRHFAVQHHPAYRTSMLLI